MSWEPDDGPPSYPLDVRRRRRWILAALVAAFLLAAGLAWRALPELVGWLVLRRVEAATGRRASLARVDLDLLGGHLSLAGFRLADRGPGPPLAEFERLDVRFRPRALLRGRLWAEEATLHGPWLRIARRADGRLNIADLLARTEARPPLGAVTVDRFRLAGGAVVFEDLAVTPARTWRASAIAVEATDLSTVAGARGSAHLEATIGGASLAADIRELRLVPLHARVRLAVRDVDASLARVYLPPNPVGVLDHAVLTADVEATVDAVAGVRLEGQGQMSQVLLARHGDGGPLAAAPSLAFTLRAADPADGGPRLDRLEVEGTGTLFHPRAPGGRLAIDRLRLVVESVQASGGPPARLHLTAALPGRPPLEIQGSARLAAPTPGLRARVTGVDLGVWSPLLPLPVGLTGRVEADVAVDLATDRGGAARVRGRAVATDVAVLAAAGSARPLATLPRVELDGVDLIWPRLSIAQVRAVRPRAALPGGAAGTGTLGPAPGPPATGVPAVEIGAVEVDDLVVAGADGPVLRVGRLDAAGLDVRWPVAVALDRFRAERPWIRAERRADGTLALPAFPVQPPARTGAGPPGTSTRAEAEPPSSAAPRPSIDVAEGVVENGSVTVIDHAVSPAARLDLAGIRLAVRGLAWPARGPVTVELGMPTPGTGRLEARGQIDLAARGLDLRVVVAGADLGPARPYVPWRSRVSGKASADLEVRATLSPLAVTARGRASLADLAVADGDRPLLTVAGLETTGLDYAWPATVTIDRLRVRKSWAAIERLPDGGFPLRALFTARPAPPGGSRRAPPVGPAAPALDVRVRRAVFEDGAATIVDGAVSPAARFAIAGARLRVQNLAWPPRGPVDLRLGMPTPGGGTLEARGALRLDTGSLDLRVILDQVELAPARPYLAAGASLAGKANADLRVQATLAPPALAVQGRMVLADLTVGDGQRTLASAKQVELASLQAEWPRRLAVERLALTDPWLLVERDAGGGLPLLALVGPRRRAAPDSADDRRPARARAGDARGRPAIEVGTLAVENGFVRFVDRTVSPSFVEEVSRLAITAQGLGTAAATRSPVTAAGRLTGGTPVRLTGVVGPLAGPLFLDLRGTVTDLPLSRTNPYASHLVGWIARRGALTATVHYRVQGDHLEAENDLLVAQPEFVPSRRGDAVRERVGVPLGLLVALLKNPRGEVHLSVPVTGTLGDRRFDFGDAVWDALRQVAIRVLALPVSWVGKIFYSGDARIDAIRIWPVYFEPGTTRLRRGFDAHAERVARFLREAPGVALTLKPVLTVADLDALRRDAVQRRVETLAREPGAGGPAAVAARLFAERFPGRPVPPTEEEILAALARDEPLPDAVVADLTARRLAVARGRLEQGGVEPARLRTGEGTVPVEAAGLGRVEFELAP